jgi:hypothetical protein
MKLTEPVGVVVPEPLTVAVSVRACPAVSELAEAERLVVVVCAVAFTVTETTPDALLRDAVFPTYWAVSE